MAREKIAIDLGNSQTKIYKAGYGLVLSEPTVIASSSAGDEKVGKEAKKMVGKTASDTRIVFPLFEGEVVSQKYAVKIISNFLKKVEVKSGFNSKAVVSVPCGLGADGLKKLESAMREAGLGSVDFVEAPILSALGQNLILNDFNPHFIVDMGAGNTNIGAVSSEGVIAGVSVNIGGNSIDTALIDFIAEHAGLQIGLNTAEKIKIQIGSLVEGDNLSTLVNGRDVSTGKPRSIIIKASDIKGVLESYYDKVAELSLKVLAKLPPEVSACIRHAGIYVGGGLASVYGLEDYFTEKFGMKINLAENPQTAVAFGGGVLLSDEHLLKKLRLELK